MVAGRHVRLVLLGAMLCAACGGSTSQPVAPSPAQTASPPAAPSPPSPSPSPAPDPADPFQGVYTLTLDLGSGCRTLLDTATIRTYTATIAARGETGYVVTVTGSRFLNGGICTLPVGPYAGLGCDQFLATRNGDSIQFDLVNNNDEAHGGHIVEQTISGSWLEIIGTASGQLRGSSVDASGSGSVWYCPGSLAYPFPCGAFSSCRSSDLRLTFTRR